METTRGNSAPATEHRKTCRLQVRYLMSFMMSLGLFLVYSMRVNLSVTIIAMVNTTAVNGNSSTVNRSSSCPASYSNTSAASGGDESDDGEFFWDPVMQGYVLNAFFYGYIITQIPAGWLAEVINPAWIFAAGIGVTSLLTLTTAVVARANFFAFLVLRVFEGISEGVTFPATYAIVARWAPVQERSFLLAISTLGSVMGTVVTLPVSALLCQYGFAGGWPSVFYITGLLGQTAGLIGATFAGCDWKLAYAMLMVASASGGALYGSESVLPVDIAAEYAGAVMGLTNCISNSAGIFTPLVVGYLTENSQLTHETTTQAHVTVSWTSAARLYGLGVCALTGAFLKLIRANPSPTFSATISTIAP
ncbi:hypothetical protein V5799_012246 [Amblyomma americanum]|uniref:Major facilitator superfamily (MFS) profile domain-containing protein n=1 Tax=Amblyomma americanum TaxID=6943 RepID=A0AAQ4EEV2_AMBAM